jgi:serine/threonine protein kinase
MIAQVGQALQFAHERGLVHRDVKPSNVMVDGEAGKLTDFDLVRETDITGGTKTGAMGTFLYAAPEVMSRPQEADVRADIYGLGMTAVFALFGGDLAMDVIRDADRFIDRLPCNPVIQDVLKKAVAWDRNERFASAAEFVQALEQAGPRRADAPGEATARREEGRAGHGRGFGRRGARGEPWICQWGICRERRSGERRG